VNVEATDLWNWLVFGVILGGVYAVAATGLVVTYTTSGIFNFAHGAVGMLAAFAYWQVTVEWGWPPVLGVIVVVLFCSPLLGAVVEKVVLRGVGNAPEVTRLVVTVALMVFFLGVAQVIWPQDVGRLTDPFFPGQKPVRLPGDLNVSWQEFLRLAAAGVVALGLTWLLKGTRTGIAMRSVVGNRDLARLNGARPDRLSMFSWAIGFGLAAMAGVLIGAGSPLNVFQLTFLVVNAYAAAMFGRLRSVPRAFIGGIVLGVVVVTAQGLLDPAKLTFLDRAPWITDLSRATPSIVLFIVLLVLPQEPLTTHTLQRARSYVPMPRWPTSLFGAAAIPLVVLGIVLLADGDALWLRVVGQTLVFGLIAMSLVPLTGWAGQISLAQIGLAGVGAITMANWHLGGPAEDLLGLVAAFVVTALVGALIALPALRLRGIYLALATFAFAVFLNEVVYRQSWAFQGSSVRAETFDLFGWELETQSSLAVLLAVFGALGTIALVAIRRGPFGRRLQAMKDSPAACATLGIGLTRTKFEVFGLSAGMAGLAGALWLTFSTSLPQTDFEPTQNLIVLLMIVAAGVTMVSGSFVAGFLMAGFAFWPAFTERVAPDFSELVTDIMLLAPGIIGISLGRNPDGIAAQVVRAVHRRRERRGLEPSELTGAAVLHEPGRDLETLGVDRAFTDADIQVIDRRLEIDAVTSGWSR
jgi:branched-chain amino acid transport system permease protein